MAGAMTKLKIITDPGNMKKTLTTALVALFLMTVSAAAQDSYPTIKLGLAWAAISGTDYTHTESGIGQVTVNESMVGTNFMFEYVMFENFGLEVDYTLSPFERNFGLSVAGTTIADNVKESAKFWSYGANLYFNKANRKGLNYWVGVSTGVMTVTHEFFGGTRDGKSTTQTLNLQMFRIGMDWVTALAGLRLSYQGQVGEGTNTKGITGVTQKSDYRGDMASIGVYAFF